MKAFRCARRGNQHQTGKVKDRKEFRCANCKGAHSSASPTCPSFHKVQDSWEIVAKEGISYAEAIRSVVRQCNSEGECRVGVNSQKSVKVARADNPVGVCRIGVNSLKRADRDDVIEAIVAKKHVFDVPTQAMKPWL